MIFFIFQSGEPLPFDENFSPMRAVNLSNSLIEMGHEVNLWSSNFDHHNKIFRTKNIKNKKLQKLNLKLINSLGYKKNVSLMRIFDHISLAINLRKELKNTKIKPDFVFIGYPPIETSYIITNWCKKNNIPYCIDVKDNWPEFITDQFTNFLKPFVKLLLFPYYVISKKILNQANMISSISPSFLKWSQNFSNRKSIKNDMVYYLSKPRKNSTDLKKVSHEIKSIKERIKPNHFTTLFVGNHYPSIDLETVILGIKHLNQTNQNNFKLIIAGYGETTQKLKQISIDDENIIFTGKINRDEVEFLSKISKVFVCPFLNLNAFQMSIPNKVIDAFLLNLPIITPLKHGDTFTLLNKKKIGFFYEEKSKFSFANSLKDIKDMKDNEYKQIKIEIEKTYFQLFRFEEINKKLLKIFNSLIKK